MPSTIIHLVFYVALLTYAVAVNAVYQSTQQAPLYSGPSDKTPLSHHGLPAKTTFEIIRSTKKYSLIQTSDGELGWIASKYITRIPDASPSSAPNNATEQPTTNNSQIHTEKNPNAVVEVITPELSPGTDVMFLGEGALQESHINEVERAPLSPQEKIIRSIDNALEEQAPAPNPIAPSTSTTSIINTPTTSSNVFDSSPHANRLELLNEENQHLRKELEKSKAYILKNIPTKDTQTLFEENELLHSQIQLLSAENRRLQETNQDGSFFNSLLSLFAGFILGFFISKIAGKRQRRYNW